MFAMMKKWTLSGLLDYFIPAEIQVDPEAHRRARMFMISHVFGPILGNTLPLYIYLTGIARDYRVTVFFFSILAFWIYPLILRRTGKYQLLALLSVQNLIFCALWACYAFGGLSSPFLPWILIFPLLAFLYLPTTGWIRNVLLAQIFGSVAIFMVLLTNGMSLPYIDMQQMEVIGMLSMASVAAYFAMMALYFARMFLDQRNFARELNSLVSTSDNVRNLTLSAQQASAAKANFVASMSHELRTPLNAIIGYSQLLIDEAQDEQDDTSVRDLEKVHKSGSDLLSLIDNILDYSRIEAGKMPLNPVFSSCDQHFKTWADTIEKAISASGYALDLGSGDGMHTTLRTDWKALENALRHLCGAISAQQANGTICITTHQGSDNGVLISVVDRDQAGEAREPLVIHASFEHHDDDSASKYGGTGIEIALAAKFAEMIGGRIEKGRVGAAPMGIILSVPDLDIAAPLAEAA